MDRKINVLNQLKDIQSFIQNKPAFNKFCNYFDVNEYDICDVLTFIEIKLMHLYPNKYDSLFDEYNVNITDDEKEIIYKKLNKLIEYLS